QFEVLYDLGRDPGETHDVIQDFPAEATRYRTLAQRYAAERPQQAFPTVAPTAAMDEGTRERLRALGYLK
ncbi:MAG: hypothetical protein ABSA52_19550, partial [Candidatus Binatia bacterium]